MSVLDFAVKNQASKTFEFTLDGEKFEFRNPTGFSERKDIDDAENKQGARAIMALELGKFIESEDVQAFLGRIEDEEAKAETKKLLETRTKEEWGKAYRFRTLCTSHELTVLESIMLTQSPVFCMAFDNIFAMASSRAAYNEFSEAVEAQKKG